MKNFFFAAMLAVMAYGCASAPKGEMCTEPRPKYTIAVTQKGVALGNIVIELFADVAPKHVCNFDSLVNIGFYNGTAFHRVIPDFMIQGGSLYSKDPSKPREKWGVSDPAQHKIPAEFNDSSHVRGRISAARTNDPNSASSQFFICVGNPTFLDGKYTVYGQVLSGMEVADMIVNTPRDANDNPIDRIDMTITKNK